MDITLKVHRTFDRMPDVDTDVIVFDRSSPVGQLGAYVGDDDEGQIWVDAHGHPIDQVTHWCDLPELTALGGKQ